MKNLKTVLIAFVCLLSLTVVYAAVSDSFLIGGTVTFSGDVLLQISSDDGIAPGNYLWFDIDLDEDNDTDVRTFTIKNLGTSAVKITGVEESIDEGIDVAITAIGGAVELEEDEIIPSGAVYEYEVTITWTKDIFDTTFTFGFTINYEAA